MACSIVQETTIWQCKVKVIRAIHCLMCAGVKTIVLRTQLGLWPEARQAGLAQRTMSRINHVTRLRDCILRILRLLCICKRIERILRIQVLADGSKVLYSLDMFPY